jgi:hypothetical protein
MKTKIITLAKWSAIIATIAFASYSIVQLIGFALSQNVLDSNIISSLSLIINNYKFLSLTSLSILILANIFIYSGFIYWSKKLNQKIPLIFATILLISSFLWFYLLLKQINPSILNLSPFAINTTKIIFSSSLILFGISLLIKKENRSSILIALSPLYILQGIVMLSSLATLIQIMDFTIAIKILEASFFNLLKKSP